jgi:hypothetical protein
MRLKYIQADELLRSPASASPSSQPCMGAQKQNVYQHPKKSI